MGQWKRRAAVLVGVGLLCSGTSVTAQTRPPGYAEAEAVYQSVLSAESRVFIQVLLTGAGFWNAVPNENFNARLFRAIQRFQSENGYPANGVIDKAQLERMVTIAGPLFRQWGFRKVAHPTRRVVIWVPLGLGLRAERNEFGIGYADPLNRLRLDFTTVPNVSIAANYAAMLDNVAQNGGKVHFRTMKDGWFVISATTPDGVDWYMRYHQDGTHVTGFTLSWNNANGMISGERIAVLMSASIWSHMTGAMFLDPPGGTEPKVEVARPTPAPPQAPPVAAAPPAPKPKGGSSGTGFFVGRDGVLLTNAHVVEDCSTIRVTPDGSPPVTARLVASDRTNDLALLKVEHRPAKIASLRIGIRLGEPVAAFGFPLKSVLASSGNFTLGNVTALAGLGDDTRHIQVSAPVQPGNSGGPLLDDRGNLVGVVTSKLDAIRTVAASGDIPQNVNFALKASAAASFLESNRVQVEMGSATIVMPPADLADHAKAISAFVACN